VERRRTTALMKYLMVLILLNESLVLPLKLRDEGE
jgi:hypothetical protein